MRTISQRFHSSFACEQHFEFWPFPCPYPDCGNGIPEDRFCFESMMDPPEEEEVFERKKWIAPEGGSYYSWVSGSGGFPAWFSVERTIRREALAQGIRKRQDSAVIYHYTTITGLKGILDSQEMWLTDYGYLNDMDEIEHGLKLFDERLRKIDKSEGAEIVDVFEKWLETMRDPKSRICIASYSLDSDSLSQWRAYGDVAIGFEPTYLLTGHGRRGESHFDTVIYERKDQERLIDLYLSHVAQCYQHDLQNRERWKPLNIEETYRSGTYRLVAMAALFKNEGFADEREVRVAYIEHPSLYEDLPLEPAPKRFRTTKDGFVPYVTTADINGPNFQPRLPIREIVVGPNVSETGKRGIREYLDHIGLTEVRLRSSQVPFRSRA